MRFFDRFRKIPELRRAIINLKSGTAFRALVWRKYADFYVLREAVILHDRGEAIKEKKIDGEIIVERREIDFLQVL